MLSEFLMHALLIDYRFSNSSMLVLSIHLLCCSVDLIVFSVLVPLQIVLLLGINTTVGLSPDGRL